MQLHRCLMAVSFTVLLVAAAQAKVKEPDPLNSFDHALINETDLAIALVEVKSIPNQAWTNSNPPRPVLRIIQLLRGGKHPWNLNAVWRPLPYDASWAGAQEKEILGIWGKTPLTAPQIDSKWYIAGKTEQDGLFHVSPLLRYRADNNIPKFLGPLVFDNRNQIKPGEARSFEEEAARSKRLAGWQENMKKSAVAGLIKQAEYIAVADITRMDHTTRTIDFTVKELIRSPAGQMAPAAFPLSGFSTQAYASLYDYYKMPVGKLPPLILFAKAGTPTPQNKQPSYIPVDSNYGVQPASEEMLKQVK